MTLSLSNSPSDLLVTQVGTVDNTTTTPTIRLKPVSKLKRQVDNTPSNDVLLTELVVTLSSDVLNSSGELQSERMYLTGGVETTFNGEDVVEYTASVRGIFNTDKQNPPTASSGGSRNYKSHSNGKRCVLDGGFLARQLEDLFESGTVQDTGEAGESITALDSVSLHTDGKLYKYHNVNYPNVVGIAQDATASGATVTYTTFGGLITGFTGLTVGQGVFADNTGDVTQSGTATSKRIGYAKSATSIRLTATEQADLKITTKGDLLTYGTIETRLPVGADGKILEADSSEATGLKWGSRATEFAADVFKIQDNTDATKQIAFQASGITTATTRIITMPDKNGTVAMTDDVTDALVKQVNGTASITNPSTSTTITHNIGRVPKLVLIEILYDTSGAINRNLGCVYPVIAGSDGFIAYANATNNITVSTASAASTTQITLNVVRNGGSTSTASFKYIIIG